MYNFEENLILSFANPIQSEDFREHEDWFMKCVKAFNDKCDDSNVNKKYVKVLDIRKNEIAIKLLSEEKIETPGRALKYLSQLLITAGDEDYNSYYTRHLFHKKLFKIKGAAQLSENNTTKFIDTSMITDADLIKGLIDYLVKTKNSENIIEQKKAIVKMKILAVETGIISS